MSDRWEHHFTLHLPSGVILDADGDPPELPNTVEDIPDEKWRESRLDRRDRLRRPQPSGPSGQINLVTHPARTGPSGPGPNRRALTEALSC